jgi:predicted lipoprotein with Yx(FWY)xxD motif
VTRTLPAIAVLSVGVALAIAGCGGSNSSSSGGAYGGNEGSNTTQSANAESARGGYGEGGSSSSSGSAAAITVASVPEVGKVLVDAKGFTLYYFEKDKGGKSACYGACASAWPPLTTSGAPHATGGAKASKLGTTERKDGSTQVTYAGWPLYTYVSDAKPGEAKGTDVHSFGAAWYPLHSNGEKAGD